MGNERSLPTYRPANFQEDGPIALKHVLNILFERWELSYDDVALLLGSVPEQTIQRWRQDPDDAQVDEDLFARLSYLLGIYQALTILIPDRAARDAWMIRANDTPVTGGRSPIQALRDAGGRLQDLRNIRRYLDAQWAE